MGGKDGHYPRGSEWRVWDLHIHSPASFHWDGARLHEGMDEAARNALIDQMIGALNDAEPAVFALMDYWTFDGWFALQRRLAQPAAPKLLKTVFPGIELRLAAPMPGRLNAHVIFSNEIPDQDLRDFKAALTLEIVKRPLSDDGLRAFARQAGADLLKTRGFTKDQVEQDAAKALLAGCKMAEVSRESYTEAVRKVPHGHALGFVPFDTNDGLESVRWSEHYSFVLDLFHFSPIFETRKQSLHAAFAGAKTPENAKWFDSFQDALKHIPRLAVSGSDAHRFKGKPGDNDKRGYGDFPSQAKTWIKADPTWLGLLQAIKEPEKRSFIGLVPPKLDFVTRNPSFYIDRLSVSKVDGSRLVNDWLHGCDIELNADLVAVIGNKGSGKSALADIVALLGNSQQSTNFQFLKTGRFRGKTGEPARQFNGRLSWRHGVHGEMLLSENPPENRVELVRYIPRHRFEELCNDHVLGKTGNFEKELRSVIFSHVEKSVSLGALDFDQLIEKQEAGFRANLIELRTALQSLNTEIVAIEDQMNPAARVVLEEMLALKRAELEQHNSTKPAEVAAPSGALTPEQTAANERLGVIATQLEEIETSARAGAEILQTIGLKRRAIRNIRDRTAILGRQFSDYSSAISADLEAINIPLPALVDLSVKLEPLAELEKALEGTDAETKAKIATGNQAKEPLEIERQTLSAQLNEPQQRYQKYLADRTAWSARATAIQGSASDPESVSGLEARLTQIAALPGLLAERKAVRHGLTRQIFEVLSDQRQSRASLFSPLQDVIDNNELVKTDYKLRFEAQLYGSPEAVAARIFDDVKRAVGELRGNEDGDGDAAVRLRYELYEFATGEDGVGFADDILSMIENADQKKPVRGIRAHLKKDKQPVSLYNYLYGLEYLEPKYTLLFQDTQIQQLSPGQRGALLLIFYLLVDKRRNPIVLDQPEENLDNETVVSLLVPVVNEAKKLRQIIMVTHNPNLAVVCDAEQIVYASFERKNGPKISYVSGSIEHGMMNRHVVNVLEGTKPAFSNRGTKYH